MREIEKLLKRKNKAVYTVALVADGWAGAAKKLKKLSGTDRQMDVQTDGRTNRQTDRVGHRVACMRLKRTN